MEKDNEFLEAINELSKEEIADIIIGITSSFYTEEYAEKLARPFKILLSKKL